MHKNFLDNLRKTQLSISLLQKIIPIKDITYDNSGVYIMEDVLKFNGRTLVPYNLDTYKMKECNDKTFINFFNKKQGEMIVSLFLNYTKNYIEIKKDKELDEYRYIICDNNDKVVFERSFSNDSRRNFVTLLLQYYKIIE